MARAFVGLGSNLDGPEVRVREAVSALGALDRTELDRCSGLYRTAPWGDKYQPDFVNAVVELQTGLSAHDMLTALQGLEDAAGRERDTSRPWGPRCLDLDLLWFDGETIDTPDLTVPHPRMHERAFVLQPLCDLEPMLEIDGRRADVLLAGLDASGIERLPEPDPMTAEVAP